MAGPDLQDLGAQRSDVEHVAAHAAHLDAVADAELPAGEDAHPSRERTDDLLHGERDPGRQQPQHDADPPGEGSPQDRQRDQQEDRDQDSGPLAEVVAAVAVMAAPGSEAPQNRRKHQCDRQQDRGGHQPARHAGVVAQQLENSFTSGRPHRGWIWSSRPLLGSRSGRRRNS